MSERDLELRAARRVTWLLLIASILVGVAHVAFLPPWEGFDETAHWSYIQELSDLGHPPRYGADGLSQDVDRYPGPMPYRSAPPFQATGRPTYRTYRQKGAPALTGGPSRYASGPELNWQSQHPPLYYALMVPTYRLTAHGGWKAGLLALRLASFALAWAGLAIGVLATGRCVARGEADLGVWTAPIMAAWPFLFPQFFPEFARLGNDSLCLLGMGAVWALTLPVLCGRGGWLHAMGLGLVLGLGLLTKAFFLPIGAAVGVLLLVRWQLDGRRFAALGQAVLPGVVALAVGGWWYLEKRLETGSLTGSDEFIRLSHAGGATALATGFSVAELARGLAVLPATFLWAGTWSLARLPEVLLAAPAALLALAVAGYLGRLRSGRLIAWAPLVFAAPMAAGLIYHIYVWMAGTGAVTPGWYFHILAAPLGLAVALGWRWPRAQSALAALTGAYTLAAWSFQLAMFSGCAAKLGADKHYDLKGASCFIDPHALAMIAYPALGAAALAAGVALGLLAASLAWRAFRPAARSEPAQLSAL